MYLFILPDFKIGGAERVIQTLITNLDSNKIDYELWILYNSGNKNNWKHLNPRILSNYKLIGYINFLFLKKTTYDYSISTHYFINYFLGLLRCFRLINVKLMCFRESTPFFQRKKGLIKFVFKIFHRLFYPYADKIIFQSKFMQDNFFENIITCDPSRALILKNPVLFKKIDRLKNENNTSIPLDINNSWVAMGRLIPEKGFDVLIRSYSQFNNKFPKLYIFGNGPESKKLNALIDKLQVKEFIQIVNYQENPYPIISKARGCIVSSRIEGFPNILNEMIYLNSNVVSTICVPEISGMKFIIRSLPNDVESLGNALCELNLSGNEFHKMNSLDRSNYLQQLEVSKYMSNIIN